MLCTKVDFYVNHVVNIDHKCIGSVIMELYEARDS